MFIDEVTVEVFGGRGGNGMASFRREKYVAFGGPSGGNGGRGGSVIFVGDEGLHTLVDLKYLRHIRAANGEHGKSKGMHGKNAIDRYIRVPLGTIVYGENKEYFIGEITKHHQELVVANGGKGGRGNMAFQTQRNTAPNFSEKGDPGETRKLWIELKVLADVGLVGYPSVGKSTIISVLSNAKPKIADYPFTTLSPNLGMVYIEQDAFVMADLPGLIENAHQGHGLGIKFLKHIERCRVFLHVLDVTREDPMADYHAINEELRLYEPKLLERPQLVVFNKIDQLENEAVLQQWIKQINQPTIAISAITQKNTQQLIYDTYALLKSAPEIIEEEKPTYRLYQLESDEPDFIITRADDQAFELTGAKIKLLFERTDFNKEEAVKRFSRQLRGLGVDDALREKGAKNGDTVRIYEFEFEFME